MTKRKSISKKIRYEVFKRDKFKCQYCGKEAPDVVLNVDHIDPVYNGGGNEITNLITSCFDCNQGKKHRLLNDDTVVKKQRIQIELIQERREQLELMLEWKKSTDSLDKEKLKIITDYWSEKMHPYHLNNVGEKDVERLIKIFNIKDILESIDVVYDKYVVYGDDCEITNESVNNAFYKLGGVLTLKNKSEVEKTISYIRGICKNRFFKFNNKQFFSSMNRYIYCLRQYGWTEEQIEWNLKNEITRSSKDLNKWYEFLGEIDGTCLWLEDNTNNN